jgi:flagellar hook-length control protein FliK
MTVLAPPSEALGAATQGLAGMPEARPPDGPGFQGALEDSLARTAIAEGPQGEERDEAPSVDPRDESLSVDRREEAHGHEDGTSSGAAVEAAASVGSASATQAAQPTTGSTSQASESAGLGASSEQTASVDAHGHGKPALSSDAKDAAPHTNAGSSTGSGATKTATSAAPAIGAVAAGATAKTDADSSRSAAPGSEPATPGSTTGLQLHALTPATGQTAGSDAASGKEAADSSSVDKAPGIAAQTTRVGGAPRLTGEQDQAPASQPSPQPGKAPSPQSGSQPTNAPSTSAPRLASSSTTVPGGALQTSGDAPANSLGSRPAPGDVRLHLPRLDASTPGTSGTSKNLAPLRANAAPPPAALKQAGAGVPGPTPQPPSTMTAAGHLILTETTQAPAGATATAGAPGDTTPVAGSTAPGQAAPAPTPGSQAAPYLANMQETIETIHATVALASRQGAAQAQISLEPAELGALRIHLTQTSEGLVARVSAETAAGAQAIASGQSELHSTLSSLGISLLRLDIGAFSQQEARAGGQAPQQSQQQAGRAGALADEAEEAATSTTTGTVALSSNSALIDVLA